MKAQVIAASWLGGAAGSLELAAALAVAATRGHGSAAEGAVLIELGDRRPCRPTILASPSAREIEQTLGTLAGLGAAARGRICHLRLPADGEGRELAGEALATLPNRALCVLHCPPDSFRALLESPDLRPQGALLRADLELDRSLAALVAADLGSRGVRVRISKRPLGWLAGRLALAGLPPPDGAAQSTERLLCGLCGRPGERTRSGSDDATSRRLAEAFSEDDHVMLGSFYGHYPDEERA